jgi:Na+-transporting NADH:ubiquinone oxidoreductase subunit C
MLSSKQKSFVFAFVMCVVCGFLLTSAAVGLKPWQERNVIIDKQKNILKSLSLLDMTKKYTAEDIERLYNAQVTNLWVDASGVLKQLEDADSLPIYVVGSLDKVDRYSVPFSAYGLWSWVKGFFALDGDGKTVVGITVYSHGETPGLGGEVEKPWFQNQFVGKRISDRYGKFHSVDIVKGKAVDVVSKSDLYHNVDGISGATITSAGMSKYLRLTLEKYEPFSKRLRGQ